MLTKEKNDVLLVPQPSEDNKFVYKAIRLTEPLEGLNDYISLPLESMKIRDFCLAVIDPETLTSLFDVDEYLDACGVSKNRGVYYSRIEQYLMKLKTTAEMIPIPDNSNPKYSIAVSVSWVDRIVRVDSKETKHGRKYAVHFDPLISPNIVHLHSNFYRFSRVLPLLIKSEYSYALYQFCIAREHLPQPITIDLEALCRYLKVKLSNFTKKTTALQVLIRDPIREINEKSDICVSYEFGKRPISTVTFYISRKYGICGSVGALEAPVKPVDSEVDTISLVKEQISYNRLENMVATGEIEAHASHLEVVLNCMNEVIFAPKGPYKINGTPDFPLETLQAAYRTIQMEDVIFSLETVYKSKDPVKYPAAFYRTTLYNAALQGRAYTDSKKKAAEQKNQVPKKRELDSDELASIERMLNDPDYWKNDI